MTTLPADQQLLLTFWNDAWKEGLWSASWPKSLEGLTAAQAAWSPPNAPGVTGTRHSIWQHVLHMCFWREHGLRLLTDPVKPTPEQIAAGNFPVVGDVSEQAWAAVKVRFAATQERIAEVFGMAGGDTSRLRYMIPHDCYHFGQINLLRALQGMAPIE